MLISHNIVWIGRLEPSRSVVDRSKREGRCRREKERYGAARNGKVRLSRIFTTSEKIRAATVSAAVFLSLYAPFADNISVYAGASGERGRVVRRSRRAHNPEIDGSNPSPAIAQ
jgi:hypothetical protein